MNDKRRVGASWDRILVAVAILALVAISSVAILRTMQLARDAQSGPGFSGQASADYGWLKEETITLAGTGTAGAVTASGSTGNPIRGHLFAVHMDYAATISDTTDLTLTLSSPTLTLLALTDYYTDTWYYPAAQQTGSDGAAISGTYDRLPMNGYLDVAVAETISGTIATVTVWWGE